MRGDGAHGSDQSEGFFASTADQYYASYNPVNAPLPHQPRWGLTQGSRFTNVVVCEDYLSFGLPPAERIFQRSRPRVELDRDYISALANTVSSGQEIVREWRNMMSELDASEADRLAAEEEKQKLRHEASTLRWKLIDAEKKAAAVAEEHQKARAEYLAVCDKSNVQLEIAREASRKAEEKLRQSVEANAELHVLVDQQKQELERMKVDLSARDSRIAGLEADVVARDGQIAGLEAEKTQLSGELASSSSVLKQFYDNQRWMLEKGVPEVCFFLYCICY